MRTVIRKRSNFPEILRPFKDCKGICVGECILKIEMPERAHAHNGIKNGWICLKEIEYLKDNLLLLHEVAHLIAFSRYHTIIHGFYWRKVLTEIGGTYKSFMSIDGTWIRDCSETYRGYRKVKK